MKISLNWLKDYVALDAPVEELTHAVTFLGFEVESVASAGAPRLDNVVVGEVLTREKHPNAARLTVCQVETGAGARTIVCGAQNHKVGDRVAVALPGAVLPGGFAIQASKIRGQVSEGMMCSARELGVGEDAGGLLILGAEAQVGRPVNEFLPPADTVFDIEVTPNRPDCLCHLGIARELAAWFDQPLRYPKGFVEPGAAGSGAPERLAEVRVEAPADCPLYSAQAITGVRIGPSPAWIQHRLRAAGLRPVNNVVDAGNFVMLEYGQPLHAFDARNLRGGRIVVRHAADGEKIVTLDGRERTLSRRMLVIADAERPVAVAGIMGGGASGVAADTADLVLECAVFRPACVRWTSRRLGLSSDSSYRYERGVDPHMAREAAARAVGLIAETAGGRPAGPLITRGGDVPWQREIVLSSGFVNGRLGFELPEAEMKSSLESLELKIAHERASGAGAEWAVSIPSWRGDLDRPIDLVEEILRLHGTDQIPPARVEAPGIAGDDDPAVVFNRRAMEYLVGHDFHECATLTLRSAGETANWVSGAAAQELALANPFVDDQTHVRPTLIMGLLEALKLNQSRGVPAFRLAEAGRIFIEQNGQNFECATAGFIMADDPRRQWRRREGPDFFTAKHHVEALAAAAGVEMGGRPLDPAGGPPFAWQAGHAAEAGGLEEGWVARFGLLSVGMVRALGIEGKIYAGIFGILPERLGRAARPRFAEVGHFPPTLRDLAVVAEAAEPAGRIAQVLAGIARAAAGQAFRVENPAVFDVYQGPGLPAGKRSLAFSLVFRAADRTLTDAEVNPVFQRIQDELERSTPYRIRK